MSGPLHGQIKIISILNILFCREKVIQLSNILRLRISKAPSMVTRNLLGSYKVNYATKSATRDDNGNVTLMTWEPSRILFCILQLN